MLFAEYANGIIVFCVFIIEYQNKDRMITMRKCKLIVGIVLLILTMCLISCSKKEKNPSVSQGEADIDSEDATITNASKPINEEEEVKAPVEQSKDEVMQISLTDGVKDESLQVVGEDGTGIGNLEVNIKGEHNQVLLCKDPVHDVVYYVNYGVDYFIYRIKDGTSELVVELPAKRLFCRDGKLYFMLDSYEKYQLNGLKSGNIMCYEPLTGKVTVISDLEVTMMHVYSDGIYYYVLTAQDINFYYYSFKTQQSELIENQMFSTYRWKEYFVGYELKALEDGSGAYIASGIKLQTLDHQKTIPVIDEEIPVVHSFIGDFMYYMPKEELISIYDLNTLETKKIPQLFEESNVDFTILDGKIYANNLIMIDPNTGLQSRLNTSEKLFIKELYTDGEQLYGLCGDFDTEDGIMQRIVIKEFSDDAYLINEGTENEYEINRYEYHFEPM